MMQTNKVIPIGLAKRSGNGKRRIDAEQVLNDIRSGMSDQSLMNKYALSSKGLQSLFEKLLDAGLITQSELEDRVSLSERTVEIAISELLQCDSPQFSESGASPNGSAITTEQVMQYARDLATIHEEEKARSAELELANQRLAKEITQRKRTEAALRESEERYRALTENSLTGTYIHEDGLLVYVNERLAAIGGYSPGEMLGRRFWEFIHPQDREMVKEGHLSGYQVKSLPGHFEFRFLCKNGETKWVKVLAGTIKHRGRLAGMGNLSDVSERKRAEQDRERLIAELTIAREALHFQASRDALTSLWNRSAVLERLKGELDRAAREAQPLAVIMADLDHFKRINDTYGHQVGDVVLQEVAARIRSSLRPYDIVGRYGGEEMLIILSGCDEEGASNFAERVRLSISDRAVETDEGPVPVTLSMGVAVVNGPAKVDLDSVISAADNALYEAKDAGRNCVMIAGLPANRDEILAESTEREHRHYPSDSNEISAY
jgi:diguanylate cyclase (GGDEF)-like protein/PAS domain S-box-containing protein